MKINEQIDGTEFACLTINADLEAENEKLKKQLTLTEKALELACEPRDDWGGREYSGTEFDNYYDYFMNGAEMELSNERQ